MVGVWGMKWEILPGPRRGVGYIEDRGGSTPERFVLREAPYTRTINLRGDKIKSKILLFTYDTSVVEENTREMKDGLIITREPFFIDDDLREKVTRWIEWANKAEPSEYDPFASAEMEG